MAIKTTSSIVIDIREKILDVNTVEPAYTDARYLARLNANYLKWYEQVERRLRWNSATTMGWSFADGNYTKVGTLTDLIEVLQVFSEVNASSAAGVPMEKIERIEEYWRRMAASSTKGAPTAYYLERFGTDTAADIGKHTLFVYPPSNGATNFSAMVRQYPALLTLSPDATPDVSNSAADTLSDITAVQLGQNLGENMDWLLQTIPDSIAQAFGLVRQNQQGPRPKPGQRAA